MRVSRDTHKHNACVPKTLTHIYAHIGLLKPGSTLSLRSLRTSQRLPRYAPPLDKRYREPLWLGRTVHESGNVMPVASLCPTAALHTIYFPQSTVAKKHARNEVTAKFWIDHSRKAINAPIEVDLEGNKFGHGTPAAASS